MAAVSAAPPIAVPPPRLLDAGDAAFTIEFGDAVDTALLARVRTLDAAIARTQALGGLPGLVETMPTFRSLTVFFDPLLTGRAALIDALQPLLAMADPGVAARGRHWNLPVCYGGDAGPDLAETAGRLGVTPAEVVALHSGTEYIVYMLGFLPGFGFMGDLPPPLHLPRRAVPRLRVPTGSVAIALGLTGIYPWQSPGGWHLLGRCPVPLFDARQPSPALLAAGDKVQFVPVPMAEYQRVLAASAGGEIDRGHWLADAARGRP